MAFHYCQTGVGWELTNVYPLQTNTPVEWCNLSPD